MTIENITIVGIVIQTVMYLLAGYALVVRHDESNKNLKAEFLNMQEQLKKLSEVITQMAVQTIRVDNLSEQFTLLHRTVEDLRRGTGYVKAPRPTLDGEYP